MPEMIPELLLKGVLEMYNNFPDLSLALHDLLKEKEQRFIKPLLMWLKEIHSEREGAERELRGVKFGLFKGSRTDSDKRDGRKQSSSSSLSWG